MGVQYVIDAFADGPFSGNPAAVVPLEHWPSDRTLQALAAQNNLSETAYFVDDTDQVALRWFTPAQEIDLCGHATLATAHAIFQELDDQRRELHFVTLSGELVVAREGDGYRMDFPETLPAERPMDDALTAAVLASIGQSSGTVLMAAGSPFVVLDDATAVRRLVADIAAIERLPGGFLLVSAPGDGGFDVVDRVFAPGVGIPEDPATGSAHCAFAPYWCERLGKNEITALQASSRRGRITCRWREAEGRVDLIGSCRTFLRGEFSESINAELAAH